MRVEGLEPPCLAAPDPKSGVSTNFTTPAGKKLNLKESVPVNWDANVGEKSKNLFLLADSFIRGLIYLDNAEYSIESDC